MSENETNKNEPSMASDTGQTEQIPDSEKQEIITSDTSDQTTIEEENQQNTEITSETIETQQQQSELEPETEPEPEPEPDTSESQQTIVSETGDPETRDIIEKNTIKEEITGPLPTEFSANAKEFPKISIGADGIMIIHDGNTSVLTSQLIRENGQNNEK